MSGKKPSDPLSVLIIGCGRIAGGYDNLDDDNVKTHAKAFLRHGGFRLSACVDPDEDVRRTFAKRWGIEQDFSEIDDAIGQSFDVASICSPPEAHAIHLERLLESNTRLVFCEKPLTSDIEQSRRLVAAYAANDRPLAVNYQRRWEPTVLTLKEEIASGQWGRLLVANGLYTKGIFANGSHLIDLLHYLVGPLEPEAVTDALEDYLDTDPSLAARLRTQLGAPVILSLATTAALRCSSWTCF